MTVHVELYATATTPPEHVWAVVGDPRRLPEWTDVDGVERVEPDAVDVGTEFVTVAEGQRRRWRVVTADARLLEATTNTALGPLGVGVRVVRDPLGARLILAASFEPAGRVRRLRARLVDAPGLRRRFDRWTRAALRVATQG